MMKKNFQFWLIYALAWLPYTLGYAAVFAAQSNAGLARAALDSTQNILPAALLGVGAIWICRNFSPARHSPIAFGLAQLGLASAYTALWNLLVPLSFSVRYLLEGRGWSFSLFGSYALQWQLFAGLMIYATIASIVYTLEFSQRARAEEARATRAEHLRTEAELNALRAQLNPHFLFNTLHSLMALVRTDADTAEEAIERFALMLRYVLQSQEKSKRSSADVTFGEEWNFVENYLELERLRLGDRLRLTTEIEPAAFAFRLPAFTLQPIVENAVKHAVAPRAGGAHLNIAAQINDGYLVIKVCDDGDGKPSANVRDGNGFGLRLVRESLAARFGLAANLRIENAPGEGFKVSITIPRLDSAEEILKPREIGARSLC